MRNWEGSDICFLTGQSVSCAGLHQGGAGARLRGTAGEAVGPFSDHLRSIWMQFGRRGRCALGTTSLAHAPCCCVRPHMPVCLSTPLPPQEKVDAWEEERRVSKYADGLQQLPATKRIPMDPKQVRPRALLTCGVHMRHAWLWLPLTSCQAHVQRQQEGAGFGQVCIWHGSIWPLFATTIPHAELPQKGAHPAALADMGHLFPPAFPGRSGGVRRAGCRRTCGSTCPQGTSGRGAR